MYGTLYDASFTHATNDRSLARHKQILDTVNVPNTTFTFHKIHYFR